MVPGNTYVTDLANLLGLDKSFQGTVRSADRIKVPCAPDIMDLPEIQVICIQTSQGLLQVGRCTSSIPLCRLAGLENLFSDRRFFQT